MKRINDLEQNSQCIFWLKAEQGSLVCFPTQVDNFIPVCTLVPLLGSRELPIQ